MLKPFKAVFLQNQNGNGLNTAPCPSFCLDNNIGFTMTHFMTRSIDFIRGNFTANTSCLKLQEMGKLFSSAPALGMKKKTH